MSIKRIGILTGGGDVPGLNSVIKSVVYGATAQDGYEVVGLRRGWESLTHMDLRSGTDANYILPLDRQNTRTIDRTGGTFLHTSRTNPAKMKAEKLPEHAKALLGKCKTLPDGRTDVSPIVLKNLEQLKIDCLVAIGGDDTLSYASILDKQGMPVVAVPKTMDNDVQNTEYCIGFSTAISRSMDAITRQRTTVGSHERVGVFRIFGRDAGYTALYTAYVTSIRCCIPEVKFDLQNLVELLVNDKKNNPSHYSLVVLAEGASWEGHQVRETGTADAYGHKKKVNVAEEFAAELQGRTGEDTLVSDLTYDLRSGNPDFVDHLVATTFATMAFECVANNAHGRMMAIRNGCFVDADIPDPKLGPRRVDVKTMYDPKRCRPIYAGKIGLPIFLTRA